MLTELAVLPFLGGMSGSREYIVSIPLSYVSVEIIFSVMGNCGRLLMFTSIYFSSTFGYMETYTPLASWSKAVLCGLEGPVAGPPPVSSLSSSCIEATLQNIGTFGLGLREITMNVISCQLLWLCRVSKK